ncbi:MAG: YbhB/YbcL family Raf kinase inhibitor-like protein [Gammaproteobacteria bacterium]|nr:MAG: YbhB/YbcL family Raf kinase inhibitor-like protein [Gammaproteobacteria bacterium]
MKYILPKCGLLGLACLVASNTYAQQPVSAQLKDPKAADVEIVGHVLEPKKVPAKDLIKRLIVPNGFDIKVFAEGLMNPRMIAVADNGNVYVTRRDIGDVVKLTDTNNDGVADGQEVVANRPGMHGITFDGTTVYLVTVNDIYKAAVQADGKFGALERIVDDLPDGGQHPNRTIAIGPDGKLYVSVGSTCNACNETNPESATILQMNKDGSGRKIFASGLRNTIGFAFEPRTGELYGMDHGIDWLGDNEQHEELNHIVKGKQYGWPYIYDDGKFNPQDEPPGNISMQEWASRSVNPVGFYTPHAAPMQMTFYTGKQFPKEYQGDAFIALRGSWNRKPPAGYEVARVHFENGKPVKFEAFLQGFLTREGDHWLHHGRLAGIAQTKDGALLLADDTNGVIYHIAYTGKERVGKTPGIPTNSDGAGVHISSVDPLTPANPHVANLASKILTQGKQKVLTVSSSAFADASAIPFTFANKGENISPPLQWSNGPKGTKSYAILMEDPDVKEQAPFVHWTVYNLPANILELPAAIPSLPELAKPEAAFQGKNDQGAIGYVGPNPPPTDPAHHYYFQIFALDTLLNLPVGTTREELLEAMKGHVLAVGTTVGLFDQ